MTTRFIHLLSFHLLILLFSRSFEKFYLFISKEGETDIFSLQFTPQRATMARAESFIKSPKWMSGAWTSRLSSAAFPKSSAWSWMENGAVETLTSALWHVIMAGNQELGPSFALPGILTRSWVGSREAGAWTGTHVDAVVTGDTLPCCFPARAYSILLNILLLVHTTLWYGQTSCRSPWPLTQTTVHAPGIY